MKGIILNITESFITNTYGEETFDDIFSNCHIQTTEPYVAPGTYPDSDFIEIVVKASRKLNMTTDEFLRKLGHYTFGKLAEKYPNFVKPYDHPKDFLKTVESVIHVEVRKLYQDSQLPTFQYKEPGENELIIVYYSERKLHALMEGLIDGVADHFGVATEQSHKIYEKNGVELCDFHLKFGR